MASAQEYSYYKAPDYVGEPSLHYVASRTMENVNLGIQMTYKTEYMSFWIDQLTLTPIGV